MKLPELLSPAGSPEALDAALRAGADAVYLGGSRFNARMNAHNFDAGALREAVVHAHHMGGRVYLTLNTLLWDRELSDALEAADEAAACGVDALIIADVGAAALIRRALPGLPLHASTQLSGHNAAVGQVLEPLGFSRFVIARETSLTDLAAAVRDNPLEVEVFIHGALCVSHSGQCLFSSVVGGRSGNRGECAQPCRLPYGCAGCKSTLAGEQSGNRRNAGRPATNRKGERNSAEVYPLSLKDLSLAAHVPALIEAGISSLKIEGRMKSPGYVGGVTAIWRRLLDEGRAATAEEIAALGDLFSREGFTDGYQVGRVDGRMMGVRTEGDKERTAAAEKAAMTAKYPPRLPITGTLTVRAGEPVTLTLEAPLYRQGGVDAHIGGAPSFDSATIMVHGDCPMPTETEQVALNAEIAERYLSRTGGTPYRLAALHTDIGHTTDGSALSVPVSVLNALRREATAALDSARAAAMPDPRRGKQALSVETAFSRTSETVSAPPRRTARFRMSAQITAAAVAYFDRLYLPLGQDFPAHVPPDKRGVLLPPVVFDHEATTVAAAWADALESGIRHVLVGNLGHLPFVRAEAERLGRLGQTDAVVIHGDFRLNVANTPAAARMTELGFADLLLSPELTLPRMRDIARMYPVGAIVYGRLPLMLLEKCAIREIYRDRKPQEVCRTVCAGNAAVLRDRKGVAFPVLREDAPTGHGHRNIVYNSLPLSMSDRRAELEQAALGEHHYLFATESPDDVERVIEAYRTGRHLGGEVRRMMK